MCNLGPLIISFFMLAFSVYAFSVLLCSYTEEAAAAAAAAAAKTSAKTKRLFFFPGSRAVLSTDGISDSQCKE